MNLPENEQRILDILISAKGTPLRNVVICETYNSRHGKTIMHNHCSKLIKFLTDKGYKINRNLVTIKGEKKQYKEYYINPEEADHIQELIEKCHIELDKYPCECKERKKIIIQIGQLNERRRGKECNICQNVK